MHRLCRSIAVILISLLALPLAVFGQTQWAQGGSIELGQTITGELTTDVQAVGYTFTAEAGTTVTITLRSDDFDSYLSLRDENDIEIAFDDDGAGNLNSRIGPFTLGATGVYTIVATNFGYRLGDEGGGRRTGRFELSVEEAQLQVIEYGQTVEGELTTNEPVMSFTFTGTEGDAVIITMVPLDFDVYDAYIQLLDGDGFGLNFVYASSESGNARIGPFILPQSGNYTIRAGSFGQLLGRFTLSIEQAEVRRIGFDETVEVVFDGSTSTAYFVLEAVFGDVINVVVDGDVDTHLTILDPLSYQVAFDDDSGTSFNPEINNFVIDQKDDYIIVLNLAQPGTTGTAALTVMQSEVLFIDEEPTTLTFTDTVFRQIVRYESDGSPVQLTITSPSGPFSPSIEIPYEERSFSTFFSGSNVEEISAVFTPPPGTISIIINNNNNNNQTEIAVEVTATRLGQ
ncbi:MAG: PPC domain-containing protein [Aggregatilineales bacterium]